MPEARTPGLCGPALTAGLTVLLALTTSACTTFDGEVDWNVGGDLGGTTPPDVEEVVVDATAGTAELVVGQTLVVDFGEINTSVGDEWVLDQDPDDKVLSEGDPESEVLGDGAPGSPSILVYEFDATAAGTSTLEFEYHFRGGAPDFGHGPTPVTVVVTVTDA